MTNIISTFYFAFYIGYLTTLCQYQDHIVNDKLMNIEDLVEWELAGETGTVGENSPRCHFDRENPSGHNLGSNSGRRGWNSATNQPNYGTARSCFFTYFLHAWLVLLKVLGESEEYHEEPQPS
jgi:hypothetical protein